MIDTFVPAFHGEARVPHLMTKASGLPPVILVLLPIVVTGIAASIFGLGMMTTGLLISLAYVLSAVVATRVLWSSGTGWTHIGLGRPASLRRTALLAVLAVVGSIFVTSIVELVAVNLPGLIVEPPDISRFDSMVGNLPVLVVLVVATWTTIGFGEEMLFRAFLISRFAQLLNSTRTAWAVAALGSSAVFGVAHFAEGPVGMATNGAFGLVLGVVYLASGRNLWVTIVAHGTLNTLRFVAVYFGLAG